MDDLVNLLPLGFFDAALSAAAHAVIVGLGLGFAFALLGLLISVPVRFLTKGAN